MESEWDWKSIKIKFRKGEKSMNYGEFGGQYVPQELKIRLNEIEKEFQEIINNTVWPEFLNSGHFLSVY